MNKILEGIEEILAGAEPVAVNAPAGDPEDRRPQTRDGGGSGGTNC